ncbi:MAG: hypothetical protein J7J11_02470 [Desulfurococcales archaeon]|nr:hypothetical protein [Desulfurococcales archaeon]
MKKRVFLGESFTNLLCCTLSELCEGDLIVDVWRGGSLLNGWNITLSGELICLDRVPLLCRSARLIESLGGESESIDVSVNFMGTEEGYRSKVTLEGKVVIQHDWLMEYSESKYSVKGGWCKMYRSLKRRANISRIYGEVQKVLPDDRTLIIKNSKITYSKILNTLPLPYVLRRLTNSDLSKYAEIFKYVSFYIVTLIIREALDYLKLTYVGRKGFSLSAVVEVPGRYLLSRGDGYKVLYSFVPVTFNYLRAELYQKVMSELRKLKIIKSDNIVVAERSYFERYGLLGVIKSDCIEHISKELRKFEIYLSGRLGSWSEKSILDILASVKDVKAL